MNYFLNLTFLLLTQRLKANLQKAFNPKACVKKVFVYDSRASQLNPDLPTNKTEEKKLSKPEKIKQVKFMQIRK